MPRTGRPCVTAEKMIPRRWAQGLIVLLCIFARVPQGAQAKPPATHAAGGILLAVPMGSEVKETYSLGFGASLEFGIVYTDYLRLVLSAAPAYHSGTPPSGPLAANPSATLWSVPVTATLQYTISKWRVLRPYAGAGGGLLYVHEKSSFDSGIGTQEETQSYTRFTYQIMVGVEQNKPKRFYGELWYQGASAGGIDGAENTSRSLSSLQIRLGFRGAL
jgi:opacity protein-like surface antigen